MRSLGLADMNYINKTSKHEVLLCSIRNYIQYPVINHNGKECKKRHNGLSHEVELEKAMAPHSSTLAWKIPWAEKPGGLQSMGSLRAGHD